ncbi:MAG TPA: transcriptional regulator [Ruminococcaceae bacterium]|jgi:transcriptional regulator with XRE-family HTH domain|nr:transcriptional regulator [Oscillospiraceae bacterium]
MSNLYNRIETLCKQAGINVTQMCREAKVSRGNLTDLKMGRQTGLSAKNANKIASYFGVTVGYLLGTEPKEKAPALTEKDERDISKKMQETLAQLEAQQSGLMFDGEPLDDETKELLAISLKNSLELAKKIAKQKYTPKKYRKKSE